MTFQQILDAKMKIAEGLRDRQAAAQEWADNEIQRLREECAAIGHLRTPTQPGQFFGQCMVCSAIVKVD